MAIPFRAPHCLQSDQGARAAGAKKGFRKYKKGARFPGRPLCKALIREDQAL
jgi:hypothetical protein